MIKYILTLFFIIPISCKSICIDTTKYKTQLPNQFVSGQLFLESVISVERQFNGDNYLTFHFPDINYEKKYDVIIQLFDFDTHTCIGIEKNNKCYQ